MPSSASAYPRFQSTLDGSRPGAGLRVQRVVGRPSHVADRLRRSRRRQECPGGSFWNEPDPQADSHGQEHERQCGEHRCSSPERNKAIELGYLRMSDKIAHGHRLSNGPCATAAGHAGLECDLATGGGLKADLRIAERLDVGPVAFSPQRDHDPRSYGRATNERTTTTEVPDRDDSQAGTADEENPTQRSDETRDSPLAAPLVVRPTVTVSGSGERRRAGGPLERGVRRHRIPSTLHKL